MGKVIADLQVNDFIGHFGGYALTCIEQCECTLAESIRSYSTYYYLLFKEKRSGLLADINETPCEFLRKNMKIRFDLKFEGIQNFLNDVRRFINHEERIILIDDTFYEELDIHCFKKQHQVHFIIPKGYELNAYTVIDREYNAVVNYKHGLRYMERVVGGEKLIRLCSDVKSLGELKWQGRDISSDLREGFYAFFRAVDEAPGLKRCDLGEIADLYRNQLNQLITMAPQIEEWMMEDVRVFVRNFDQNYLRSCAGQALKNPIENLPTEEFIRMKNHAESLGAQRKFFDLKMESSPMKVSLMGLFDRVIDVYSIVLGLLRKSLEDGDKTACDRAIGYLSGIAGKEAQLYEELFQVAEKYICLEIN